MANYNPPNKGEEFIFFVCLEDFSNPGSFKSTPTLATGDFKVSKDGGSFANLNTIPTVTPAASVSVKVTVSATEMDADNVLIVFADQTSPKEWADKAVNIITTTP